jgi:Sulfotransferase family
MLPNLLVIGAAKAGTTALQHYLAQHPDIFMSPVKEPNFFAFGGAIPRFEGPEIEGADWSVRDRLRRERYEYSVVDAEAYLRLFAQAGRRRVRGDVSPAYLYFPGAAQRIKDALPAVRIVAVLRNPVDRAHSKFLQMRRDRGEPLDQFEEALAVEPERERRNWAPTWLYAARGFYSRQLEPYYCLFGAEQIHVVLHEDLQRHPEACLRRLFSFVGIDPNVRIDVSLRHNVTADKYLPRHGLVYHALAEPFLRSARLQAVVPARMLAWARPTARQLLLRRLAGEAAVPLTLETRRELTARFAADILRLEQLIGRDLGHWLDADRAGNEVERIPVPPVRLVAAAS